MKMFKIHPFAALLLAASLTGGMIAYAADPAASPAKPAETAPARVDLTFPDGEDWVPATEREKMAYLLGVRDMAAAEYQLTGPNPKHRTLVERWVEALDGLTLRQIMEGVDAFYKANPDKQQQTVFEVVWFEMVQPKSAKPARKN